MRASAMPMAFIRSTMWAPRTFWPGVLGTVVLVSSDAVL